MQHHTAAAPYDWRQDTDFARVLAETGEPAPQIPEPLPRPAALEEAVRRAHLPEIHHQPAPGTVEARTADGRPVWLYLDTPTPSPAPAPAAAGADDGPLLSRRTRDLAALSLAFSGAAWIGSLALANVAEHADGLAALFRALGVLALGLAFLLGLLRLARRGGTTVHIDQTVNASVSARGPFARARVERPANTAAPGA